MKRNGVFKTQVEMYKKQLQDSQTKCSDETKRADKAEFESKRMQEKLTALQREKEVRIFTLRISQLPLTF